jgi:hypothetical protein
MTIQESLEYQGLRRRETTADPAANPNLPGTERLTTMLAQEKPPWAHLGTSQFPWERKVHDRFAILEPWGNEAKQWGF